MRRFRREWLDAWLASGLGSIIWILLLLSVVFQVVCFCHFGMLPDPWPCPRLH